jgi:hypothetical protein
MTQLSILLNGTTNGKSQDENNWYTVIWLLNQMLETDGDNVHVSSGVGTEESVVNLKQVGKIRRVFRRLFKKSMSLEVKKDAALPM